MLYDWAGNPIENPTVKQLQDRAGERMVHWEPVDRSYADVSRGLAPRDLDMILLAANNGDTHAQQHLCLEIEEKDFQTAAALSVRRAAVQGLEHHCEPPAGLEDDATAKEIAAEADRMLQKISAVESLKPGEVSFADEETFTGALGEMLGALLPGYHCMEILWQPGGAGIKGFATLPVQNIIFRMSRDPLLWSRSNPTGFPLAPFKFVFHRHKARSGDMARGGLIRPLGWLFCFERMGEKNLLRFTERYGMPFNLWRIDDNTWKTERNALKGLIQNFGSDGGAIVTKAVEAQLLESSNTGDLFFKLLEYFGEWKTKTIIGQLASSAAGGGLSGGDAQSQVREDILASDCRQVSATVRRDILRPWVLFNYGEAAPVPEFVFQIARKRDLKSLSEVVLNLKNAGKTVTDQYIEDTFSVELEEPASEPPAVGPVTPPGATDAGSVTRPTTAAAGDGGAAPGTGAITALAAKDAATRPPSAPADARAYADAIAARSQRTAAAAAAQAANEKIAGAALEKATTDKKLLAEWLGPIAAALAEALAALPEPNPDGSAPDGAAEKFQQRLAGLLKGIPGLMDEMDTTRLEEEIAQVLFAGDLNGRLQAADGLGSAK
ncbi:MAG: DUF935 family protein [Kiritimatiellaeota bacterium]|nr:DUF935 family protein [Kiritimatiellota bacterium]